MFHLKFKTDNAAFQDGNKPYEIARILKDIAEKVEMGYTEGNIKDLNGNTIGKWKY